MHGSIDGLIFFSNSNKAKYTCTFYSHTSISVSKEGEKHYLTDIYKSQIHIIQELSSNIQYKLCNSQKYVENQQDTSYVRNNIAMIFFSLF